MRRRGVLPFLALSAVMGGLFALAVTMPGNERLPAVQDGGMGGPALVLRGVEVREIPPKGPQIRLFSEEATYRIPARTVSGTGVRLALPSKGGDVIVRAKTAKWDMDAGLVRLPEGCSAENAGGWTASLPAAVVFLPQRVLAGEGRANLSGPGLSVAGDNLVWRWREGTLTLAGPKTRFEPARIPHPGTGR